MMFTSLTFGLFFAVVFFLYWFIFNRSVNLQNLFLLVSSYTFYGWFNLNFLFLLIGLSILNYTLGSLIQKTSHSSYRKMFFIFGMVINIGTLFIFKYFAFFVDSFIQFIRLFGFSPDSFTVRLILPIGISFYIFLSISYIIDVYQRRLIAVGNVVDILLSFSFFPIILAGPIQRPKSLLTQIQKFRVFQYAAATDGLKQILWGLFMKVVIADNCVFPVNAIFKDFSLYTGSTLVLGVFLFSIQIYADFAGYSNMAIGIGKLLGFNIMKNFSYPYFSSNIREFWKRWNISLTTWFRDYVFLPASYSISRKIKPERICSIKTEYFIYSFGIFITWTLTGLWHGANFTFIIWGLIHGCSLVIYQISMKFRKRLLKKVQLRNDNTLILLFETGFTFCIVMIAWIFFKADSVNHALRYISRIFSNSFFTLPQFDKLPDVIITLLLISIFFIVEWFGRNQDYAIATIGMKWPKVFRWSMYCIVFLFVFWFSGEQQQFIYFQF